MRKSAVQDKCLCRGLDETSEWESDEAVNLNDLTDSVWVRHVDTNHKEGLLKYVLQENAILVFQLQNFNAICYLFAIMVKVLSISKGKCNPTSNKFALYKPINHFSMQNGK